MFDIGTTQEDTFAKKTCLGNPDRGISSYDQDMEKPHERTGQ